MPIANIVFSFLSFSFYLFIYYSHNNIQSLCKITHALRCRHNTLSTSDRTQCQMGGYLVSHQCKVLKKKIFKDFNRNHI